MFNPIIETAIGLIFVYLLLSMICSALQEWIATLLGLRAKTLFEGITKMLCGDANLRDQIYAHPLIDGLSRKSWLDKRLNRTARPSYISPATFSKAFLAAAAVPEALAANLPPAKAKNEQPLNGNTQELIATLRAGAPGNIEALRQNVEDWYNDAMDRVSGWYKRKTQGILLILGLVVAVAFNADTIMLARAFWADPNLRAGVAAAAQQYVTEHPNGVDSPSIAANAQISSAGPGDQTSATDIANNYPSTTDEKATAQLTPEPAYSAQEIGRAEQQYRAASAYLQQTTSNAWAQLTDLKVPIGWCADTAASGSSFEQATSAPEAEGGDAGEETGLPCTPDRQLPRGGSAWVVKIFGLLITMIALSQGAPFWFDLLKKVVNLRLAGDAPDEKKK